MTQAAGKIGVGLTVSVAVEQHCPSNKRILQDDLAICTPEAFKSLVEAHGLNYAHVLDEAYEMDLMDVQTIHVPYQRPPDQQHLALTLSRRRLSGDMI